MVKYQYINLELKLRDINGEAVITPVYVLGSIKTSLQEYYGEITSVCSELELVQFDADQKRGILRVPCDFYTETRAALALISKYQNIPCYFNVLSTTDEPPEQLQ